MFHQEETRLWLSPGDQGEGCAVSIPIPFSSAVVKGKGLCIQSLLVWQFWANIPLSEVLIPGGDWNGHVRRAVDGFEEVHGGFGYGERNDKGVRLLDFAHDLVIGNTLFKKRNSHLITYASGDHENQVDYILFRRGLRKHIWDVKVILGEECLTQHRLLVCIFKIAAVPRVKRKFTPWLRTWKLRDPACAAEFEEKCSSGKVVDSAMQSSEEIWDHLKSTLNNAAEEVCGY